MQYCPICGAEEFHSLSPKTTYRCGSYDYDQRPGTFKQSVTCASNEKCVGVKTLELTLKKEWYDMTESGEKPEEYRDIKPYWKKRLEGKHFTHVRFRNGYRKDSRSMILKLLSITIGCGNPAWGAVEGKTYYVLKTERV